VRGGLFIGNALPGGEILEVHFAIIELGTTRLTSGFTVIKILEIGIARQFTDKVLVCFDNRIYKGFFAVIGIRNYRPDVSLKGDR
jgi:hypothetical protein